MVLLYEYELDSVLEEIMTRWGIPGLGVGIVKEGAIAYAKSFGVKSLETRASVQVDSTFCLASISKCFVASAVMQQVEQGKIELDAPLVSYLPYFKLDDERYPQITIRQILSHTSGMPDMDEVEYNDLVLHPETDDEAAERYVRAMSRRKLVHAPGERFSYSNIAYNLLGDLIAKTSRQTFEAYMKEHILFPAGMSDSTFLLAEVDQARQAMPHLRSPEMIVHPNYPYHRADAPASFLHSTVIDMCHWSLTCLNHGSFNEQQILTPASYELMWTPAVKRSAVPLYENMGLGWILGHFEGLKTVSHGGGGFGWTCFLVLLPEREMAAIILCNEESSGHTAAVKAVMHTMFDREPEAGAVSWMVPITKALQAGGIQAAQICYDELKNNDRAEYYFDEDGLLVLVYQLIGVNKLDLAIDVLKLNIRIFPENLESYTLLSNLYIRKCKHTQDKEIL